MSPPHKCVCTTQRISLTLIIPGNKTDVLENNVPVSTAASSAFGLSVFLIIQYIPRMFQYFRFFLVNRKQKNKHGLSEWRSNKSEVWKQKMEVYEGNKLAGERWCDMRE